MSEFLLDANLSPETAAFLRAEFGVDATDASSLGIGHQIVERAQSEDRVIVTFDLGFGEMFHRGDLGRFGVILLRLDDQTVESANAALGRFLRNHAAGVELEQSLVVIDEYRVRIARTDK